MTKEDMPCDLCGNGTVGRCARCQREIEDQLRRMGITPRLGMASPANLRPAPEPERRARTDTLELALVGLRHELIDVAVAAAKIDHRPSRAELKQAVSRFARARGEDDIRARSLELAALLVRFAPSGERVWQRPDGDDVVRQALEIKEPSFF